jgi:hypothetical protein
MGRATGRRNPHGAILRLRAMGVGFGHGNPDSRTNPMNDASKMEVEEVLRVELEELKREHRDLDDAISALQETHRADQLRLRRLKKQKLALKDKITVLEDKLTPDIIA